MRDFDFADGVVGSEAEAAPVPIPNSVLLLVVVAWATRRLARPLGGCTSLSAEKKRRWRGHSIACQCVGLLWKPSAGCRMGEVELPDKNSGATPGDVDGDAVGGQSRTAYLWDIYTFQALLGSAGDYSGGRLGQSSWFVGNMLRLGETALLLGQRASSGA